MLKSIFVILVIFLFALSVAAQKSEPINWQADYATALAAARKSGKPILLDFTAKWCVACQEMEKSFWTRPDVAEAMKSFVAVKIDYDAEKKLVNHFAVRGLPYIAFSDPIGNLITYRNNLEGNGAEALKQIAGDLPKSFSELEKAYKAYDLNDRDGAALLEMAEFYSDKKQPLLSRGFYQRAAKAPEIQNDARRKDRVASGTGFAFWKVRDYARAIESLEEYLKLYPSAVRREDAYAVLAVSYANVGNFENAEIYLKRLKTEFPDSKHLVDTTNEIKKTKAGKDK